MNRFTSVLKDYALLWAMLLGVLFHPWLHNFSFILPYTLFLMLTLSYTRIKPSDLKIRKSHLIMLVVQWTLGILSYFIIAPYSELIAQGIALIILTPTATAASVVTYMLGGSVAFVTTSLIISNIAIALFGPLLISGVNPTAASSYTATATTILLQVSTLLLLPLVIIWALRYSLPKWHEKLSNKAGYTFYIWVFTVLIVSAKAVQSFKTDDSMTLHDGILMGLVTFATTVVLYFIGGRLAKWTGTDVVNGRQGFGQKNTIFAIWLALAFLAPKVALIPTFYIIWQNLINSLEISAYKKYAKKSKEV